MKNSDTVAVLKEALEREVSSLEELAAAEQELQPLLAERNWMELEKRISALNTLSESAMNAEQEREAAYAALKQEVGAADDARFYDVLESVDWEERCELAELYRRLKIAVVQVRGVTGSLDTYVSVSTSTVRGVLDELFPDQKGKIYSRTGRANQVDERAMVLDRQL